MIIQPALMGRGIINGGGFRDLYSLRGINLLPRDQSSLPFRMDGIINY